MKGYLHLQPISKMWLLSYEKNSFTTTYIPVKNFNNLLKKDDNKKVEFMIEEIDNKEIAHINYENL